MGQESFIYSFVARGTMVLAEYTEFTGNFPAIAAQCLQRLPSSNNKFTYKCDHHIFNFLVEDGYGNLLNSFTYHFLLLFNFDFKWVMLDLTWDASKIEFFSFALPSSYQILVLFHWNCLFQQAYDFLMLLFFLCFTYIFSFPSCYVNLCFVHIEMCQWWNSLKILVFARH